MPRLPFNTDGSKHVPRDDFETPSDLLKRLGKLFNITVDAAAAGNKYKKRFRQGYSDAFAQPWRATGAIFANPPGSQLKRKTTPWIHQAIEAGEAGQTVFLLVPSATGSRWFKLIWDNANALLFFNHRLVYELEGQPQGAASFDSALAAFGRIDRRTFASLKDQGQILFNWRFEELKGRKVA